MLNINSDIDSHGNYPLAVKSEEVDYKKYEALIFKLMRDPSEENFITVINLIRNDGFDAGMRMQSKIENLKL